MSLDPVLLLAALHPPGEVFSVCAFGGDQPPWVRHVTSAGDAVKLAAEADRLKGREGVYHCVQNLKAKPAKGRGGEVDAKSVNAVWADVDAMGHEPLAGVLAATQADAGRKGAKDAKNRAWAEATADEKQKALNAALEAVKALPIGPPSALVTSGRGWHPYWFLVEPCEDLALVKGVNAKIAELLHADNCADLARVLKIPGTRNRKIPSAPEPVTLMEFNGEVRYRIEDLAEKLGAKPIPLGSGAEKPARAQKPAEPDAPLETETEDQRVRRAIAYVEKIPGGVSGEGGHGQTWKAALAVVRGFDLPPDTAYNVLAAAYNPRCQPQWSEKDLRHKVESAASTSRLPRGYLLRNGEHEKDHDIARAAARFSSESVEALESVEEIYEAHESLPDLAVLAVDDPAAFAVAKARIAEKFKGTFKERDFQKALQPLVRELQKTRRSKVLRAEYGSPAAMFPDAGLPAESTMPVYWHADPVKGLGREVPTGPDEAPRCETVCPVPVFVASRFVDLSAQTEILNVTWPRCGIWRTHPIARGDAADRREVIKLAHHGFPVHAGNAVNVIQYLSDYEHANIGCLPVSYVASRFGPTKDERGNYLGFMCGKTFLAAPDAPKDSTGNARVVTFQASDVGDSQIADSIHPKGTLKACVEALAKVSAFPRAMIALYASIAPPLLSIIGAQNFGIDWWRDTSQGKTKTMMIAACPWGNPDPRGGGFIGTWDGTRVSFERRTTLLNGLPVIADESQRARTPEEMGASVYDVINGQARARGTIKGLAQSLGGHVVLLSTGERPLVHAMKFGGLKARVISIHGGPFGDVCDATRDLVDEVSDALLKNYGHLGPAFVTWVHANRAEWESWRAEWEEHRFAYRGLAKGDNVAGRMADYLATLELAAHLLHRAVELPWSPDDIVQTIWEEVASGAAEADVARAAFEDVLGWCRANENAFMGQAPIGSDGEPIQPNGGWFGVFREDGDWEWGIIPHKLTDFLKTQGYDPSVLKTWTDRAWLDVPSTERARGRDTIVTRFQNKPFRVYALSRKTIWKIDKDEKT